MQIHLTLKNLGEKVVKVDANEIEDWIQHYLNEIEDLEWKLKELQDSKK